MSDLSQPARFSGLTDLALKRTDYGFKNDPNFGDYYLSLKANALTDIERYAESAALIEGTADVQISVPLLRAINYVHLGKPDKHVAKSRKRWLRNLTTRRLDGGTTRSTSITKSLTGKLPTLLKLACLRNELQASLADTGVARACQSPAFERTLVLRSSSVGMAFRASRTSTNLGRGGPKPGSLKMKYCSTRNFLGATAALALFGASTCTHVVADELTRVSGASPFGNCTADNVADQVGTNYPDSEIEPWLAVNPLYSGNLIAGWQQDRWSNGGSRGLVAGVSLDGGRKWTRSVPRKITLCTGGEYDRASDPWVAISPNGVAYFQSLGFDNDRPDGGLGKNAVLVSRSHSWGFTWSDPISLIVDSNGQVFNDKNSITADPYDSRFVYSTWDRLVDFTLPEAAAPIAAKAAPKAARERDSVALARDRYRAKKAKASSKTAGPAPAEVTFTGPTYFARTVNGGASWEPAKKIYDPGPDAQTINNLTEVLADGSVAVFFTNISSLGETSIGLIKSNNKGRSFSAERLPIPTDITVTGTRTPDAEEAVRDGNILFDTAIDRRNGNLYLVWQDARFAGIDQVAFSMSSDRGKTWSTPVKINMTPPSTNPLRNQAFIPSVEVGPNHQVVVTYYDFRNDVDDGKESTDFFAVFCTPSFGATCALAANWGDGVAKGKDIRITGASFDMLDAPVARGHFLGDYMGLARRGETVMPAFGIADRPNKVTVYTKPIGSKR